MNCEEVKNQLLDYHDKALDTSTMTRIATHLISCAPCGAEANGLADCIEQVAALPNVDVPIGFTQRVMAHVRDMEDQSSIRQRWFLPWRSKLSLPATGLVLVGVLGVFLYQKEEDLKLSRKYDSVTVTVPVETGKAPSESSLAAALPSESPSKPAPKSTDSISQSLHSAAAGKSTSAKLSQPTQTKKRQTGARLEEDSVAKRPPIQVQEASNPTESGRFIGDAPSFPAFLPFGGVRHAAPRSITMERFIPSLGERVADHEFIVRRRWPQRRDQEGSLGASSVRRSTEADSAANLATPPAAPAFSVAPKFEYIAEIRFYNVAPQHFEFFKQELAAESIIESESPSTSKEEESLPTDRQLLIKVTILPAAPPEPPTSSR